MNRKVLNFEEIDELAVKMARKLRKVVLGLLEIWELGKRLLRKRFVRNII